MKKKKVINSANRRCNLPIVGTIAWYLFLDKMPTPEWLWGIMILLIVIVWITAIIDIFNREELEPFK